MEKKDIVDRLFNAICDLTEHHRISDGWNPIVISDNGKALVKETILKVFNECHDDEIGELKAKVYAYEKIIANSNFAPILDNKKEKDDIVDCEDILL